MKVLVGKADCRMGTWGLGGRCEPESVLYLLNGTEIGSDLRCRGAEGGTRDRRAWTRSESAVSGRYARFPVAKGLRIRGVRDTLWLLSRRAAACHRIGTIIVVRVDMAARCQGSMFRSMHRHGPRVLSQRRKGQLHARINDLIMRLYSIQRHRYKCGVRFAKWPHIWHAPDDFASFQYHLRTQ